ncbi:MAG: hypothetical protein MUP20_02160, partial [Methyloceanibacter sp.]|nr:hypothetical protein [Methyloceanibacter sp.]
MPVGQLTTAAASSGVLARLSHQIARKQGEVDQSSALQYCGSAHLGSLQQHCGECKAVPPG